MKSLIVLTTWLALTAAPTLADIHYKARTASTGDNANQQMEMFVESWVNEANAKIYFEESSNPFMKKGMYLVTNDGGQTLFLVDPEQETYAEWNIQQILEFSGAMLESMGPIVNLQVSDPDVRLISEEAGPTIVGLPTTCYRFETSYQMLMKIIGIKRQQTFESDTTLCSTEAISDAGLSVWQQKPPKTGYDEIDKLAESAWSKTKGVTLRMTDRTVSTTKKGKSQTTETSFEVMNLDRSASGPPGGYSFPGTYTQTTMMPSLEELQGMEGESEEDGKKKKKKRFGGLFDGR